MQFCITKQFFSRIFHDRRGKKSRIWHNLHFYTQILNKYCTIFMYLIAFVLFTLTCYIFICTLKASALCLRPAAAGDYRPCKGPQTNCRIFCVLVPTVEIAPSCNSEPKLLLNSCAGAAMCLVSNKVNWHKQITLHQFCNQKMGYGWRRGRLCESQNWPRQQI